VNNSAKGWIYSGKAERRLASRTDGKPLQGETMRKVARKENRRILNQRRDIWHVTRELETADYIAGVAVVVALMTFISFFRICILGA